MRTLLQYPNNVFLLLRDTGTWMERADIIASAGLSQGCKDQAAQVAALNRAITQLRNVGHVIEHREEAGQMFYRLQQP